MMAPFTEAEEVSRATEALRKARLRPTRQRIALARLLLDGRDRHVTAEELYGEAQNAGADISLATIYNTLNQFTESGLLREVVVETGRSYFDTNTDYHHHFFHEDTRELEDIPAHEVRLAQLPQLPPGTEMQRIDVVVRIVRPDAPRLSCRTAAGVRSGSGQRN